MPLLHQFTRSLRRYGTYVQREVPKTKKQFTELLEKPIEQPEEAKLLRVAIVGCPNVGKSTLLNQLINWKVSAVSSKVHTTQKNVIGVFVEDKTQIEFIDTPGLVNNRHISRHNLEKSLVDDVYYSMVKSDVIAILADVSNERERHKINRGILEMLRKNRDKESILLLNKIDRVKQKRNLLDITSTLCSGIVGGNPIHKPDRSSIKMQLKRGQFDELFKETEEKYLKYADREQDENSAVENEDGIGWPNFSRVFMISALHNDGVDDLRRYLLSKAKHRPWLYSGSAVTLENPKNLIFDGIREVCLELFHQEIPYSINFEIVMWDLDEVGNLFIAVNLFCPAKFQSLIIGPKGSTISTIVRKSREALCTIFRCDVSLKIAVKGIK
ncbi:PREDICTED: GTPase Era, mitochondrial-like [Rhagoletis zephyria]|uniref:GTPase Era, mitochondrial-like n=1 Tax=Rhagoletis zephyria TaxID=28612 RepID=UPI00081181E4|nr:PREDICTED: GTPase Era, mitochondrial-like [Rhagoletis zephyria]